MLFAVTEPWINGAAWAPDQVRGLVGYSFRLFADFMPIPNSVGNAKCRAAIDVPTTRHRPQATRRFSWFPGQGWHHQPRPASIQRAAPMIGLPSASQPHATSYKPQAVLLPRTHRADTRVRPYDEVTRTLEPWVRNYRPQATGHKPLFPDSPGEADTVSRDPGSMQRMTPKQGYR